MDLTPLAELLSAPSKQAVDDFLCACAQEREEPAAPTAARVAELASLFGLTEQRALALQRAGAALIGEAIYSAASVEQVGARFPDDFQPQLKGLILRVFEHRMDDWRAESVRAGGIAALPRLMGTSYQVYRKPAAKGTQPVLLLGLELDRTAGHAPAPAAAPTGGATSSQPSQLHIEMTSEQLDAMLAGLSKIKDQLAQV